MGMIESNYCILTCLESFLETTILKEKIHSRGKYVCYSKMSVMF